MICPTCQHNGTRVLDSRPADEGRSIRRRRECEACSYRFTTFEKVEEIPLIVVKKDGAREEYSREKILRGLISCFLLHADNFLRLFKCGFKDFMKRLYKVIQYLYQPLIGGLSVSLYLTLLNEVNTGNMYSKQNTHRWLMDVLGLPLDEIYQFRMNIALRTNLSLTEGCG